MSFPLPRGAQVFRNNREVQAAAPSLADAAPPPVPPYVPPAARPAPVTRTVRFDLGAAGGLVQMPCLRVLDQGPVLVLVFDAGGYLIVPPLRLPGQDQPLAVAADDDAWLVWSLPEATFVDNGCRYVLLTKADADRPIE